MTKTIYLGNFNTTGELIAIDPCYNYDEKNVIKVLPGVWNAYAVLDEDYNLIRIIAETGSDFWGEVLTESPILGVDSGQLGLFDAEYFKEYQGGEYGDLNTFYGRCCEITCDTDEGAGVVDKCGVIGSCDDGEYLYTATTNEKGDIVRVLIEFYVEDEDEDYSLFD